MTISSMFSKILEYADLVHNFESIGAFMDAMSTTFTRSRYGHRWDIALYALLEMAED